MSRLFRISLSHALKLVVALSVGLILAGCEQQPLGKRIAQSLPQVDPMESGTDQPIDPANPAANVTQDAASWKRYCSFFLLNTIVDEPKDPTPAGDNKKPQAVSATSRQPDAVHKYKSLYDEIPAEVIKAMIRYNVRNYSVHIGQVGNDYYAVRYFEYSGSNPDVDMTLLARHPAYHKWREACKAYEKVLLPTSRNPLGPFMEEAFYRELRPK